MRPSNIFTTTTTTLACILGVAVAAPSDGICTTVHGGQTFHNELRCIAEFYEHGDISNYFCHPKSDVKPGGVIKCVYRDHPIVVKTGPGCNWKSTAGEMEQLKQKGVELKLLRRCMSERRNPYPPYSWNAGYGIEQAA